MRFYVLDIKYEIYFSREAGFFLLKISNSIFNINQKLILFSFKSSLIFNFMLLVQRKDYILFAVYQLDMNYVKRYTYWKQQ